MDEENKNEDTQEDAGEGVQSETDKEIERINADTERINKAIAENENAKAREKLGGRSEGGQETKPVSPEDKKTNQAKDFFKDTALGDAIEQVNKKK